MVQLVVHAVIKLGPRVKALEGQGREGELITVNRAEPKHPRLRPLMVEYSGPNIADARHLMNGIDIERSTLHARHTTII